MKKRTMNRLILFLTATLFTVASLNVVAQEKKAGVIDKTGNFVIFPQYDEIRDFHEGLAAVKNGESWGFVDKTGKEVVSPRYYNVTGFSEGLAGVQRGYIDGPWGLIDKTGEEIVSPHYEMILGFSEGLAGVRLGGKWGFIDKTGKEVISPHYDWILGFSEGLAGVRLGGKWGFIDKTGRVVLSPRYDLVTSFSEGLAAVQIGGKWGFIDKTGKEVVSPRYEWIDDFSEGLAGVEIDGKCGFIDKTGKEVISPRYNNHLHIYGWTFHEGLARVEIGGKWGFIDKTGKEVVSFRYDEVGDFSEGLARVEIGGKWGFIDKIGKEVVSPRYDDVMDFSEGLAYVEIDGKCGFIDKTGKEVIPPRFASTLEWERRESSEVDRKNRNFSEGLAVVHVNSQDIIVFEKYNNIVQNTWNECNKQLFDNPHNTEKIQLEPVAMAVYFMDPRIKEITDSIVSELKQKTSELKDYCLLFENCNKKLQTTWNECNQQLMDYPYNTEKLQLEPVSLKSYFLDPRLETITDSIVAEIKQKTKDLQEDCYKRLKSNQPEKFAGVYLQLHPEARPVLENLKLECRCNNYSEAELVIKIADNTVPQCTCRNDYWNQYGNLFSSRTEFDNTYNTSEQGFLDDVKLRQSLKADIQEIASMLSGLKAPKFKDGLTGKNEDIIQLLKKVQYHKGKYYYDEVVDMMFAADASMTKEWEKKGSFFSSRNEFYEAYVSGDYKNVLKEKKSK